MVLITQELPFILGKAKLPITEVNKLSLYHNLWYNDNTFLGNKKPRNAQECPTPGRRAAGLWVLVTGGVFTAKA
jgi:hypothetical protein